MRGALAEVDPLTFDVAAVALGTGIRRADAALGPARDGYGEADLEEYREVPVASQLWSVQEDAVDNEDRVGWRGLFGQRQRAVAVAVEDWAPGRWNPSTDARMTGLPDRPSAVASPSAKVVFPAPSTPSTPTRWMWSPGSWQIALATVSST